MNSFSLPAKLSTAVLAVTGATSAFPAPTSDAIHGVVRQVHDTSIEVCFYDGYTPVTGEQFALLRNIVVAVPKAQSPIRRADVGAIEFRGSIQDGCAVATLLRGDAKTSDWIAALRDGKH